MASQDRDRLEVMIIEAQGLPAVEGGAANPYVSVEVGDEKRRTSVEPNTLDPIWEEESMVFSETTSRKVEQLILLIKHHDPVSHTDRVLGMVIVDTATALQSPGISTQGWFAVRKGPGMRSGDSAQGRVHVKLTYFMDGLEGLQGLCGDEDDDDDDDDGESQAPNVVTLLVESGRNLRPPASVALCDSMVAVKCAGKVKHSKAQKKTNNPRWHFQAQLANNDPSEVVVIEVLHCGTILNKLIGQARLNMVEIAYAGESLTRWLPLFDDKWGFEAVGRGEVVVTARWHYDKAFVCKSAMLPVSFLGGRLVKRRERQRQMLDNLVEEFEYDDKGDEENKKEEDGEEGRREEEGGGVREEQRHDGDEDLCLVSMGMDDSRRRAVDGEERRREQQALSARREHQEKLDAVRPGDYRLQVHVIEVSELRGRNSSGTSDPTVHATCLGVTKHTRVRRGVNSAVFDEVLYFNLPSLSRDQLMQATVQLRVLDANTFLRDSLIGSYQFDLLGIYVEKGHEVYRKWVALQDTESEMETGVQGFLKLSLTVLGPGDRQIVHDLTEEIHGELAKEAEVGAGRRGGLVLMDPALIPQELHLLVVYIFSAQDVLSFSAIGPPSINAVVQVDFAGNPPVRTSTIRARGRDGLGPAWTEELWLPVMVPNHSNSIDLSVWHKEVARREVVAHAYFDFSDVPSMPEKSVRRRSSLLEKRGARVYPGPPPTWVNLYGAPQGKGKGREAEMMNRYPSRGSVYRGRLLVSMRVEPHPPARLGSKGRCSGMEFEVPPEVFPETAKYTLRALVLQGSDIPVFKFPNAQGASRMKALVTLGPIKLEFRARNNQKGIVEWNQGEEARTLEFPSDPGQMPDIFVYLVREIPESHVSFARIPAVDIISQRFQGEPFWQELTADKTRQGLWAVGADDFPGSLLIRLGLGRDSVARHNPWEEMRALSQVQEKASARSRPLFAITGGTDEGSLEKGGQEPPLPSSTLATAVGGSSPLGLLGEKMPYCLRVHLFQCRGLPSSEASGLLDPYIKVRFMGRKQKTAHEGGTADPCFYQTVEFHEMLPGDLKFAPEIRVEVWDKDVFGSNTHVAGCRFPMSAATLSRTPASRVPPPAWHHLRDTNGQPGVGELLLSLQLFPKRTAHDKFPKAPSIAPTFRMAYLEVVTVGVRDLKPYGFQAVGQPYVQFEMTSGGERVSFTTQASKFPSGKNANFAERRVRTVLLPDDPLFAPQLCIKVLDKRVSGLTNPVVGTCSVNLAEKMPWNDEGYRPPQSQSFDSHKDEDVASWDPVDHFVTHDRRGGSLRQRTAEGTVSSGSRRNLHRQEGDGSGDGPEDEDEVDDGKVAARNRRARKDRGASRAARFGRRADNGGSRSPIGEPGRGNPGATAADQDVPSQGSRNEDDRGSRGKQSRRRAIGGNGGESRGGIGPTGAPRPLPKGKESEHHEGKVPPIIRRPASLGVGALADDGAEGNDGLELPLIEEDLVYQREKLSRGHYQGRLWTDWSASESRPKDGAKQAQRDVRKRPVKVSTWYEKLMQGGSRALGALDLVEEERWTLEDLNIDFPHEWASSDFLRGRSWWLRTDGGGNEIEHFLEKAPFENYPLYLGAEKLKGGLRLSRQSMRRRVGLLKGLVIVTEQKPNPDNSDFVDMRLLRSPRTYCCRLYVVKALHLQPKDPSGLADAYLRLKVGKLKVDDGKEKENVKPGTLNPEFFRSFEFQVTIPGESQLKLKVFDHDRFASHELIGQTSIDLEDRWFSRNWHNLESQDSFATEKRQTEGPFKPLEVRDLMVPSSTNPQGQVMMWLDMLTLPEARRFPCVRLEPPAPLKVEVRVACWRSEDVIASSDFSGLRDLYCRMWMETDAKNKRDTDTHWRCRRGKGSWNYRLKFDVDLPLKSPEHGRLVVQMWDRGVLSANDIIAETSIDLYRWFLKVYRDQVSTKPFRIVREARKEKARKDAFVAGWDLGAQKGFGRKQRVERLDPRRRNVKEALAPVPRRGEGGGESPLTLGSSTPGEEDDDDDDDSVKESEPLLGREDWEYERHGNRSTARIHGAAMMSSDAGDGSKGKKRGEAKDAELPVQLMDTFDDTEELINTIKDWLGMGNIPDDAQWLELTRRDPEAGTVERMGRLLISLEVLPKDAADAQPVGSGRSPPNQNPYLPPPAGRVRFSFNPVRLSISLLGRRIFYKLVCCCLCIFVAIVIALAGGYILTFESLF